MKILKTNLLLLFLNILVNAAYAGLPYTIHGSLRKEDHQTWAHLYTQLDGKAVHDSARIVDGHFTFTGNIVKPTLSVMYIMAPSSEEKKASPVRIFFYLEAGNISITNEDASKELLVSGTPMNKEYNQLKAAINKANAQPADSAVKNVKTVGQRQQDTFRDFITQHPASSLSLDVLFTYVTPSEREELFNILSPELKNSEVGLAFAQRVKQIKLILPGNTAPEFTEKDTAGIAVSLKDFRGKYVLIDFWASWCKPCRAENPNVLKAYNKYKDRNFTVLGVSLDKSRANWIKAIREDNLPWQQISPLDPEKGESIKKYAIEAIPQNFLISPEGKIIATNLRGKGLEKLDELLK